MRELIEITHQDHNGTTRQGTDMAKFLGKAKYGPEGIRGLIKDGGTARRAAAQQLIEGVGGTLEAFYFAYGDDDAYVLLDLPDATAGLAASLAVNASGAVSISITPLITPEEMDQACKKSVQYKAPRA